jgi:hypothetical protein
MFWNGGRNDPEDWQIVPMSPVNGGRGVLGSPLDRSGEKDSMAAGLIFQRRVPVTTCQCCQCL